MYLKNSQILFSVRMHESRKSMLLLSYTTVKYIKNVLATIR